MELRAAFRPSRPEAHQRRRRSRPLDSECLYSGVVRSMALYGAPIWVDALTADNRALLRKPQRVIAVRDIRGYRTVSWTAVTLRCPGRRGSAEVGRIRALAQQALITRWQEDVGSPTVGLATVEAIRPHLSRWIERKKGTLTFRMTVQVLTGHGCFGKYLHGIVRREVSPSCYECGAPVDTAHHSLSECTAWGPQRHTLAATMGGDLSPPSIVKEMLGSETCWSEMRSFCENVISRKEAAEREREEDAAWVNPAYLGALGVQGSGESQTPPPTPTFHHVGKRVTRFSSEKKKKRSFSL
ncbi:uncharacterized protein LOC135193889 [Vanessa tameamea]|uniref:Uncharacterized protein LOC135193889 n=1 Tax=Vanessa tameamea TaxID=334116 RepID=A0ABM4ASN6_VANTA